jgi:DNA-binding IclR family transcriptional regulator
MRLRERVKSEFSEMPGLSLTVEQAGRLLALECGKCGRVLEELVREGFLRQERDGSYGRHDRGA